MELPSSAALAVLLKPFGPLTQEPSVLDESQAGRDTARSRVNGDIDDIRTDLAVESRPT